MRRLLAVILSVTIWADSEIYVDQAGDSVSIDIELLGDRNLVGGLLSESGSLTPFDLDGDSMTLNLDLIGDDNTFLGDIWSDTSTFDFSIDGDSTNFEIQVAANATFSADSANVDIDISGSSSEIELNIGTLALATNLDLDWSITGDSNEITSTVNSDQSTQDISIDGDSNTWNITQKSTLASDWLQVISVGDSGNWCIIQDDGGTATSC